MKSMLSITVQMARCLLLQDEILRFAYTRRPPKHSLRQCREGKISRQWCIDIHISCFVHRGRIVRNTKRAPGHASRVYTVKFKQDEPNVLVSGGWDNTIHVSIGQPYQIFNV